MRFLLALLLSVSAPAQANGFTVLPSNCATGGNTAPVLAPNQGEFFVGFPTSVLVTFQPNSRPVLLLCLSMPNAPVLAGATTPPLDLALLDPLSWPMNQCFLWSDATQFLTGTVLNGANQQAFVFRIPANAALAGFTLWMQAHLSCPTCAFGFYSTNGLETSIQP
jgi:hypothetical protein